MSEVKMNCCMTSCTPDGSVGDSDVGGTASFVEAPLLDVRHLNISFPEKNGTETRQNLIVRDISFQVCAGKTLCLVGESGCGKSMTSLALMGLVPENGQVRAEAILFQNQNLATMPETAMQHIRGRDITLIFQEPMTALNPVFQVGEQVAEVLRVHLGLSRAAALQQTIELFRQVGIPAPQQRVHDYPYQLSGGMRQRVMISMALACKPALLLADEPTTALDVTIQGQILRLMQELCHARNMGILLITHDFGVVAECADDVCVMYAGRIVEQAPVDALFAHPRHPYTQGLLRSIPSPESTGHPLQAITGNVPSPDDPFPGCAFMPRCEQAHPICTKNPPEFHVESNHAVACWLYATP